MGKISDLRILTLILILLLSWNNSRGQNQQKLLENPVILAEVKKGLDAIYSFDFELGKSSISEVRKVFPDHPVTYFMESLLVYWQNFPLIPDNENSEDFVQLMEKCIDISSVRLKENENDLEAIFFDLFGRAFYVMYWADNGKPGKVVPHLNTLYKHTMEGFEIMKSFNEFYFTTGLYNYYIEAYPEKHPAYKTITAFFQDGNKTLGLKQLQHCADNAIFLRVEAKLFLSLLYLNYEIDMDSSSIYAAELYKEFPDNPYYAGKYLEILIYNKKYFFAPVILKRLKNQDNDFAQMQYLLFNAMYLEKSEKNYTEAKKLYEKALVYSSKYGYFTDHYTAMAYMGLGRHYQRKGNSSKAGKHFRDARKNTSYDYVIQDR